MLNHQSRNVLRNASMAMAQNFVGNLMSVAENATNNSNCNCVALKANPSDSLIDYDYLICCNHFVQTIPSGVLVVGLLVILFFLLYMLSSTADSFFCPSLQAIVETFKISPNIAGVTFLSFGNGSPDVFSNLAAFSTGTPTIGVSGILGGGLFVTTVVAGAVGLAVGQGNIDTNAQQLIPRKFVRDIVFYIVSVLYLCFVFYDGLVNLLESIGFLVIYLGFVFCVVIDEYCIQDECSIGISTDTEVLLSEEVKTRDSQLCLINTEGTNDFPSAIPDLSRTVSAPECASKHRIGELANPTHVTRSIRAASAGGQSQMNVTSSHSLYHPAHFGPTARRWTRQYQHKLFSPENLIAEESPESNKSSVGGDNYIENNYNTFILERSTSLREYRDLEVGKLPFKKEKSPVFLLTPEGRRKLKKQKPVKSRWMKKLKTIYDVIYIYVFYPIEVITTIIRRLTIPLVDYEMWNVTIAVLSPPCIIWLFLVSVFKSDTFTIVHFWMIVFVGGSLLSGVVSFSIFVLKDSLPPCGWKLAIYIIVAFIMSVIWIMNIAKEVLAVLGALGTLLGISNSVLGITVLAWGNSMGDLVSDVSIAKEGFPIMAFAGVFAGPMFNLLIGLGLSLTIQTAQHGHISMGNANITDILGFGMLLLSLIVNLVGAGLIGKRFCYTTSLCYILFTIYAAFILLSLYFYQAKIVRL